MTSTDDTVNQLETAEREARAYAAWLAAHGYHEASLWWFRTTLDNYGPGDRRTETAVGYAVRYAGTLVRNDGSTAEHPTAGITVFCQDSQLPLSKLAGARALVTFSTAGAGGRREYGSYTPYYVASYNPRKSDVQRDQQVNPGALPLVILHELTPAIGGGGPMRFYDLRLDPAGDLSAGDRVRVLGGNFAGLRGTVVRPDFLMPMVDFDNARGRVSMYRSVPRELLEPGDGCADGHPLRWNKDDYEEPRWVHVSVADLAVCTAVMAADEADPCDIADAMNSDLTPGSDQ
jgi:hypothetical protein